MKRSTASIVRDLLRACPGEPECTPATTCYLHEAAERLDALRNRLDRSTGATGAFVQALRGLEDVLDEDDGPDEDALEGERERALFADIMNGASA